MRAIVANILHQSIAYGKCVGQSYQEVSKGMCDAEFRAFKECVQVGWIGYISQGLLADLVRRRLVESGDAAERAGMEDDG